MLVFRMKRSPADLLGLRQMSVGILPTLGSNPPREHSSLMSYGNAGPSSAAVDSSLVQNKSMRMHRAVENPHKRASLQKQFNDEVLTPFRSSSKLQMSSDVHLKNNIDKQ